MKEEDVAERVMSDCSLLYKMRHAKMSETCMCWGWECGSGWHSVLERLSYDLETINILFYPKYKLRIQADQVKEKYGTLRFYYSIVNDNRGFWEFLASPIHMLHRFIENHVNFKMERVVVEAEYKEDVHKELTKVEFIEESYYCKNFKDTKVYEKDGKYYKDFPLLHLAKTKLVPTKHKILYKINDILVKIWISLAYSGAKCDRVKSIVAKHMESAADRLIKQATEDCMNVCEDCGAILDDKTRCTTTGWVSYICQRCADKLNRPYIINDEVWKGYKRLQTAKERKREIENFNKKYSNKESEYEKFKEALRKAKAEELEQQEKRSQINGRKDGDQKGQ